jgi:hypothetical protein
MEAGASAGGAIGYWYARKAKLLAGVGLAALAIACSSASRQPPEQNGFPSLVLPQPGSRTLLANTNINTQLMLLTNNTF